MNENVVFVKAKKFAGRIIKLCNLLKKEREEYILYKQLLRSGTGIGANLAEANCAQSKKDFYAKVYISFKECSETLYWLEILCNGDYITTQEYSSINDDCLEIYKLLTSITKSDKRDRN